MRYLGNKARMLENIEKFISELGIKGKTFCDLFTGSGSVADHFKDKYQIICNDLLVSSQVFAYAKINNAQIPKFEKFVEHFGCDPFKYFSQKDYEYAEDHFIWKNYSPAGDRQFFLEEVANKIDGIRIELDSLKLDGIINQDEFVFLLASLLETIMGLSNTTGTYEAFLKDWDSRAYKRFNLVPLGIENKKVKSKNNVV